MAPWTSIFRGDPGNAAAVIAAGDSHPAWHGVARHLAWTVADATESGVVLRTDLSTGWEPGGHLELDLSLASSRLRWRLTMTAATSGTRVALGWHPWFVPAIDGCAALVSVPAVVRVQRRTEEGVATREWARSVVDAGRRWDDCVVAEWPLHVDYGPAGMVTINASSRFATVFTPAEGVCIEPVTSPAEFSDDVLAAGECLTLTIDCEYAPSGRLRD